MDIEALATLHTTFALAKEAAIRAAGVPVPEGYDGVKSRSFTVTPPENAPDGCGSIGVVLFGLHIRIWCWDPVSGIGLCMCVFEVVYEHLLRQRSQDGPSFRPLLQR